MFTAMPCPEMNVIISRGSQAVQVGASAGTRLADIMTKACEAFRSTLDQETNTSIRRRFQVKDSREGIVLFGLCKALDLILHMPMYVAFSWGIAGAS